MRCLAILAVAAFASVTLADEPKTEPIKQGPRLLRPADAGIGRLISDISFTDISGKGGKLSDTRSAKLTVVAFTSTSCPLCKKYAPLLGRLEQEYTAKGVEFVFVYPIATDKTDRKDFAHRMILDRDGTLTAAFGASTSSEVFILDTRRTLQYRGAIDDQYGLGYSLPEARNHYLKNALDALLAGKAPTTTATEAVGCALEPDSKKAPAVPLTYHARIERIIQTNCVDCHRQGGVAPFALEKYEEVVAHAGMIKKVIERGAMPPWFASHQEEGRHFAFLNDRSLTSHDRTDLTSWLSGDRRKGDPADAPLPRRFESGWLIGKPDVVFQIPKPIAIKAEGTMPYQNVNVETRLDEDKWVRALELQPTAREVVHHVLVHAIPKGSTPRKNLGVGTFRPAEEGRDEAQGFFAIYVPGNSSLIYPEGFAKKLPRDCILRFQIHYTPNGKATEDQTRFGMVFAKEPPRHEVKVVGIVNDKFLIPPGQDNYKVSATIEVPIDAHILAFAPHMHLRGKAAKYELRTAEGQTTTLLDVPHYDFNWQLLYRFAEPVPTPKKSRLTYTAWFDNSDKNPANPNSKTYVGWGLQTYEEMHLGYVEYYVDGAGKKQDR